MRTRFFDLEDESSPLNGTVIETPSELGVLLKSLSHRPPFIAEFIGENGIRLTLGLGNAPEGCAQFTSADGLPPYLLAVSPHPQSSNEDLVFLMGHTATPMSRRNCLPVKLVEEIAAVFVETGQRKLDVNWEEV
jgi:hypothetical protein